jgi:hypothetical protein
MEFFDASGIPYARPLLVGTYTEAMNFPIRFDSTLPRLLELPGLPGGEKALTTTDRAAVETSVRNAVRTLLKTRYASR